MQFEIDTRISLQRVNERNFSTLLCLGKLTKSICRRFLINDYSRDGVKHDDFVLSSKWFLALIQIHENNLFSPACSKVYNLIPQIIDWTLLFAIVEITVDESFSAFVALKIRNRINHVFARVRIGGRHRLELNNKHS